MHSIDICVFLGRATATESKVLRRKVGELEGGARTKRIVDRGFCGSESLQVELSVCKNQKYEGEVQKGRAIFLMIFLG